MKAEGGGWGTALLGEAAGEAAVGVSPRSQPAGLAAGLATSCRGAETSVSPVWLSWEG